MAINQESLPKKKKKSKAPKFPSNISSLVCIIVQMYELESVLVSGQFLHLNANACLYLKFEPAISQNVKTSGSRFRCTSITHHLLVQANSY